MPDVFPDLVMEDRLQCPWDLRLEHPHHTVHYATKGTPYAASNQRVSDEQRLFPDVLRRDLPGGVSRSATSNPNPTHH